MRLAPLLLAFTALAAAAPAQAQSTPIIVGGDPLNGPCFAFANVTGLDPYGDNFLSVREAPTAKAAERDRLGPGTLVRLCVTAGAWYGVIYGDGNCTADTPIPIRGAYRGPCRYGWVFRRYITINAG